MRGIVLPIGRTETEDGQCELVDMWTEPPKVLCRGTAEECRRVLEGLELLALGTE